VPSNVAEGQSRHTVGELVQFISPAEGSLAELGTQLLIAIDLSFCIVPQPEGHLSLVDEPQKMRNGLRQKLATNYLPLCSTTFASQFVSLARTPASPQ
jgi:four helix bundle protein